MASTMTSYLLLWSSIATPILAVRWPRFAEPAIQAIVPRAEFGGGWPLALDGSGGGCPDFAPGKCEGGSSLNQVCCPSGQSCLASTLITAYCCPTSADCKTYVNNFPVCANETWIMYNFDFGFFCCEEGQIGVEPITGYDGLCVPSDQVVPASLLAKTATQNVASGTATGSASKPTDSKSSTTSGSTPGSSGGSDSSSDTLNKSKSDPALGTGPIIGIVIGGVGLILLAGILWALIRRNNLNKRPQAPPPGPMYMPTPPAASELPPNVQRKPVPHMMATSMYSGATPGGASPGAFSNPPLYDTSQGYEPSRSPSNQGRYDPPRSPNNAAVERYDSPSSHPYDSYHEMEGPGAIQRAELRGDRTGN